MSECERSGTRGRPASLDGSRGAGFFSGVLCVGECDRGHVCWRPLCGAWLVCSLGQGGVAFVGSPGVSSRWTGGGEGAGYRSCSGGASCSASSSEPVDPLVGCVIIHVIQFVTYRLCAGVAGNGLSHKCPRMGQWRCLILDESL